MFDTTYLSDHARYRFGFKKTTYTEFEESVGNWLQHRPTTGNSDIIVETGNTNISEIMTDNVEIPTTIPTFSTMSSPIQVSPSDYDNDNNRKWL